MEIKKWKKKNRKENNKVVQIEKGNTGVLPGYNDNRNIKVQI